MRFDLDRTDPQPRLALDHHAVAALGRKLAGEIVVEMADGQEADRDDPRRLRRALERIDLARHYPLPIAAPSAIHHCSACSRGLAIASTAAPASTTPPRLLSSASSSKLSAIFTIACATSGTASAGGVRKSLRHSISSSRRAINSKFSAACSRPAK